MSRAIAPTASESLTRIAAIGVLVAACFGGIAESEAAGSALLGLPVPEGENGPLSVRVSFDLRDINEIDDEAETFEFGGVLTLRWHDPRQAFDPAVEGGNEKLYQGAFQFNEVYTGWFPQAVLVNESGLYEKHGVLLRILPDGSLTLIETVNAAAKTDLDLSRYPFDRQRLEAVFEVLGFDESEVVMEVSGAAEASSGDVADLRMPQWSLSRVVSSVRSHAEPHAGRLGVASAFVLTMDVERKSLFMARLVIVPLFLIVMLSWSVFWMEQSSLGDRISVSFIGILTVVAYQMVLSEILPRISYVTFMNGFLNMSFFVMCANILVSLWVGWLDRTGQSAVGDRIDRRCRWIFPVVYFGLILLVVVLAFYVLVPD